MNRTALDARHTAVIQRWWIVLRDQDGKPPRGLLDELADVVSEQETAWKAMLDSFRDEKPDLGQAGVPKAPLRPPAARKRPPAARRATK